MEKEDAIVTEIKRRNKVIDEQNMIINDFKHKISQLNLIYSQKPLINELDERSHTHDGRWQDMDHPIIYWYDFWKRILWL